uniref:signal peptide peptidase-like 2B isoform X6 n=1 Tax=Ictidomys tridecemlineatus TaxID=43179 RepID=UPI001A9CF678|nr:signal peptide peptidase-like 2B isoform X6 [Ictidomys tridecemlineatus]
MPLCRPGAAPVLWPLAFRWQVASAGQGACAVSTVQLEGWWLGGPLVCPRGQSWFSLACPTPGLTLVTSCPVGSSKKVHETQAGRRAREAGGGGGGRDARHDRRVRGHVLLHAGAALPLLRPPGLCHHRDLLPGLLHRPLQLPGPLRAPAALLRVQRPQARMLLLALLCIAVSVVWGVFRNEDQWAWVLQDTLGVAFCLYMLRTVRLPTFKACTLLLLVLFVYDVFFVFVTPFLTKSGNSIMVEVATGPSDSATREKLPMVLKVPRLNASPLALCDRPFSLLGFGDILVPGLLVAYCHRFDIQAQSSRVYFVACTVAYGIGLLVTFVALALMQRGQPALLYLVPCTLVTSCLVALWRRELGAFWTGSGFAKDLPQTQWAPAPADCPQPPKDSDAPLSPQSASQEPVRSPVPPEKPQEPSTPEETGAAAPAQEPQTPDSSTPESTGLAQPSPTAQPGTLA